MFWFQVINIFLKSKLDAWNLENCGCLLFFSVGLWCRCGANLLFFPLYLRKNIFKWMPRTRFGGFVQYADGIIHFPISLIAHLTLPNRNNFPLSSLLLTNLLWKCFVCFCFILRCTRPYIMFKSRESSILIRLRWPYQCGAYIHINNSITFSIHILSLSRFWIQLWTTWILHMLRAPRTGMKRRCRYCSEVWESGTFNYIV